MKEGRKSPSPLFHQRETMPSTGVEGSKRLPEVGSREQGVPGLLSCCPRRRRPLWRTGPACARRPRQCPRWRPRPAAAPAAVGCGCGRGLRATQSGDLQGQAPGSPGASSTQGGFTTGTSRGGTDSSSVQSWGWDTRGTLQGQRAQVFPAHHCCLQCLFTLLKLLCAWSVLRQTKFY